MSQSAAGEDCTGRGRFGPVPFGVTRGPFGGGRRRLGVIFVWLLFILFPLVSAIEHHGSTIDRVLLIAGAAAFVATYVSLVLYWHEGGRGRLSLVLFVLLCALATALTVSGAGWGFLFAYCAASAGLTSTTTLGFWAVALCALLAAGASLISDPSGGSSLGYAASAAGVGLLMLAMRDLRMRNEELIEARAELARLAVAQERERFARDLHDLLGHSLSVIALKAELAGRMLPSRPSAAADEIAEVEKVARGALGEVREAVSGYRRPTLEDELAGARMALAAAGIDAEIDHPAVTLDPGAEAVLAWAVREGATNVIRHSRATRCRMKISATLTGTLLEVVDNGVGAGAAVRNGGGGHGLEGLAERADSVHGKVEAGARYEGGYRLAVSVPVAAR